MKIQLNLSFQGVVRTNQVSAGFYFKTSYPYAGASLMVLNCQPLLFKSKQKVFYNLIHPNKTKTMCFANCDNNR